MIRRRERLGCHLLCSESSFVTACLTICSAMETPDERDRKSVRGEGIAPRSERHVITTSFSHAMRYDGPYVVVCTVRSTSDCDEICDDAAAGQVK